MKNIIHDLNFYFSDQCDSMRKLSGIVGAKSEIIPGWMNDGLNGGAWILPIGKDVWEKCGKDQAWYGWNFQYQR